MTTQPAHLCFNQAIREEYRKSENAFDQVTNIALGVFRFAATLWAHSLALTALLILFLIAIAPTTLTPLWASALSSSVQAGQAAPPYLAGEWDADVTGPMLELQQAVVDQASKPSSSLIAEAEMLDHEGNPLPLSGQPVHSAKEDAWQQAYARSMQDLKQAIHLLRNLLISATLISCAVGVFCNTGRFSWVYRDRAWARVHAAEKQRELLDLCRLAATQALAQHRESTLVKGQEVA
ncbi:hypothetical protein [Aeromonas sp. HMWF014]|uniref:hypothetical protein n=1 Tax=Aeromonas sp. HMWF014 TaxID=2056850 RepID=UPI000D3D65B5|nr:hypothetical protein [Aeromonas sp. HMWF014]PTT50686.1 hypothetical protein DBR19_13250 [Aeromonas sp. HMWF014]